MSEKYKDDWLKLSTKWMAESNLRFKSGVPEIQEMVEHLQNTHRTVENKGKLIFRLLKKIMI